MFDAAFIEQCKYEHTPTHIVQKIISNESGKNPYAININYNGKSLKSFIPKDKDKAEKIATEWIKKGYTVDIGLMQINSANLSKFKTTVGDALDPCHNIKIASTIYYNFYQNTPKNDDITMRTKKALSAYNTGSYDRGFKNGYVSRYFSNSETRVSSNTSHNTSTNSKKVKAYAKYLLSIKFPSSVTVAMQ
ncbi:MAG: lytic transglycosylase domain-containing protein [Sulfurimonas sp.]|jgi:type IV secretion system protein VirB1|uniref:lytic transglycosylase domain-containing protein n=1 Tax=Sulfurimonas sp. TaxID=2022749 RepID=UPI003563931F